MLFAPLQPEPAVHVTGAVALLFIDQDNTVLAPVVIVVGDPEKVRVGVTVAAGVLPPDAGVLPPVAGAVVPPLEVAVPPADDVSVPEAVVVLVSVG